MTIVNFTLWARVDKRVSEITFVIASLARGFTQILFVFFSFCSSPKMRERKKGHSKLRHSLTQTEPIIVESVT